MIKINQYSITITCEICGEQITVESDTLNGFIAKMGAAYDGNWTCSQGHVQPSVVALKKRRNQD